MAWIQDFIMLPDSEQGGDPGETRLGWEMGNDRGRQTRLQIEIETEGCGGAGGRDTETPIS